MIPRVDFFNVSIVDAPAEELETELIARLHRGQSSTVMSLNLTSLPRFDQEMHRFAGSFDFVTADGNGFVRMSHVIGKPVHNQIAISSLSEHLLRHADSDGLPIYLLGGTNAAVQAAAGNVRNRFDRLRCIGRHGYFDEFDDTTVREIASELNDFRPEVVLVGISSPKKERIIKRLEGMYGPCIFVACGGFIDILAGKVQRAPRLLQALSLEWIFRFLQEPRRLFGPMLVNGLHSLFVLVPRLLMASRRNECRQDLPEAMRGRRSQCPRD